MPGRRLVAVLFLLGVCVRAANAQTTTTIEIRGRSQTLHLHGPAAGQPLIIASGDGGWFHLSPHVAAVTATRGYCVVGLDVRGYLESFTSTSEHLHETDISGDFRTLAAFAERWCGKPKPVVVGISVGAGLAIAAGSDPSNESALAGVVGIGLGDVNELAWRWRDDIIYLTHRVPNEPTFEVSTIIDRVAPLPLALIHSTHDEFAPLTTARQLFAEARTPKRLWVVEAASHRFSGSSTEFNAALFEALAWIASDPRSVPSK